MTRRLLGAIVSSILFVIVALHSPASALEECRLLRQPDIHGERVVFVYAGDLWTVAREGGTAARLTSHEGVERFPKFSPDGKTVAFTAEYDGNFDAFTIPVEGGEPKRLTWHPAPDQVVEWYPDGKSILLRSAAASAIQRYDRFYRIDAAGGFPELLPLPTAGFATLSPDGQQIAFVSPSYDNRTWKRYLGGNAPDIWVYDFAHNASEKITDWAGADEWPMWNGRTIYYCSDRGEKTANLWSYDLDTKTHRQLTRFAEYDVKWPSIGGDAIVFENGGYLYVMDLPDGSPRKIRVQVPDDKPAARPEYRAVSSWIESFDLSPSGKRAVFAARGDVFTVPAEKGSPRDLTATPGARERDPAWSPDGRWIAYLSDKSGEYEIHVAGSDGHTPDRQVTRGGSTFRYAPAWSPDSKKLAFSDKTGALWWCDAKSGKLAKVDQDTHGEIHQYVWSGDSRWIAYTRPGSNNFNQIALYSLESGRVTQVSSGMTDDYDVAFDPGGKYLFFISRRNLDLPAFQWEYVAPFAEMDKIYAITLQRTLPSPAVAQSDEEDDAADSDDDEKDKKAAAASRPWKIDLAGIGDRVAEMPIAAGRYGGLEAFDGKLMYLLLDAPLPDEDEPSTGDLQVYDLDTREEKTLLSGVDAAYAASADGSRILYRSDDEYGVVEAEEGKKIGDGKLDTESLMAWVDPPREWKQMFEEAWRLERDFYYDPAMGGLDWKAIGSRYRQLLPFVAHRSDLNYVLGEMVGELSTSHTYVGGGDAPEVARVDIGLLGADYALDRASGRYRFTNVYRERDWNSDVVAPLGEPGVEVAAGDYLLAVNDRPLQAPDDVYAAFVGTTDRITRITVGSSPNDSHPRTYSVKPIESEASLRYTAWVRANRERVAEATGGRIAYIHVPSTANDGIVEFTKQYYPQVDKDGIIVDERFNSGGFIPDFFVERLRRTTWAYWSNRDGADFHTPLTAIDGPKCILINQYAGSGGDAFPYYFRLAGLGPVIGKRTWGGLVGISHDLPLVDGGVVTMPDFGMWDPKSEQWVIENHGVDPDVEIENPPDQMVSGHDPQLERAIQYCLEQLAKNPPRKPTRPKYKIR